MTILERVPEASPTGFKLVPKKVLISDLVITSYVNKFDFGQLVNVLAFRPKSN